MLINSSLFTIFSLTKELYPHYKHLTFPIYEQYLDSEVKEDIIAFGAHVGLSPVGLILAIQKGIEAEILSIVVDVSFRGQGISTQLLNQLEHCLKKRGCSKLTIEVVENNFLLKMLQNRGYSNAQNEMYLWHLSFKENLDSFFEKFHSSKITLFKDISSDEIEWLKNNKNICLEGLHPFGFSYFPIEYLNSVVCRNDDGKIIGWLITHRIDDQTIRYSSLYIIDEYRKSTLSGSLIYQCLAKQFKEKEKIPFIKFGFIFKNFSLLSKMQKYLNLTQSNHSIMMVKEL